MLQTFFNQLFLIDIFQISL